MLRYREAIQAIYRLTAPCYEPAIGPVLLPLARDLVRGVTLPDNATIVDVGTGTGFLLRVVAAPGRCCIGIDLSLAMLRAAQAVRMTQGWPGSHLVQGDASRLEMLAPGSCAAAVASFGLSECDPDRALRAIHRILRPGGRLRLQEWGPYDPDGDPRAIVDGILADVLNPEAEGLRAEFRAVLSEPSRWQARLQDADDYAAALEEAGLAVKEACECRPVTLRLPVAAFLEYALAWAPRAVEVEALAPADRAAFLRQVTAALDARAEAGGVLTWAPLVFRATGIRRH